jgi:hypothetical protein
VAAPLKLGNECLLPLDCGLAVGYGLSFAALIFTGPLTPLSPSAAYQRLKAENPSLHQALLTYIIAVMANG